MKKLYQIIATLFISTSVSAQPQFIAAGIFHSFALCTDSSAMAWGSNDGAQLGNNDIGGYASVPVQVSFLTGIVAIGGGYDHSLALKNDGTVWAWGKNYFGQLGNGSTVNYSKVPVQVGSLTGIVAIAGGAYHSLALKNDGTVWAWGWNDRGQLGNGTNTGSNAPVQVSSLIDITAIAGGYAHSLALKNDGTALTWGWNINGQLGNGTNTESNIPVQAGSLTGIVAIACGGYHSLILKSDETVWAWGHNIDGQLGNGITTNSNVPVQSMVCTPTGTREDSGIIKQQFSVYPNPNNGKFTLLAENLQSAKIKIYNLTGEIIYEKVNSNSEIDLSKHPKGIYSIVVNTKDKLFNRKLIIQ